MQGRVLMALQARERGATEVSTLSYGLRCVCAPKGARVARPRLRPPHFDPRRGTAKGRYVWVGEIATRLLCARAQT